MKTTDAGKANWEDSDIDELVAYMCGLGTGSVCDAILAYLSLPDCSPRTRERLSEGLASPCSALECWARHTIMDGKVVTYSTSFEGDGKFPNPKKATGHFDVSASRNAVVVHRCEIRTDWQLETFKAAIDAANRMHCELAACDGRPDWTQPNDRDKS